MVPGRRCSAFNQVWECQAEVREFFLIAGLLRAFMKLCCILNLQGEFIRKTFLCLVVWGVMSSSLSSWPCAPVAPSQHCVDLKRPPANGYQLDGAQGQVEVVPGHSGWRRRPGQQGVRVLMDMWVTISAHRSEPPEGYSSEPRRSLCVDSTQFLRLCVPRHQCRRVMSVTALPCGVAGRAPAVLPLLCPGPRDQGHQFGCLADRTGVDDG